MTHHPHHHDPEIDDLVSDLEAQLPQVQSQTGGGAAPTVSRECLTSLATAAFQAYDSAESQSSGQAESAGAAAKLTPEEKKARRAAFVKFFLETILPAIIAGISGAAGSAPAGA